MREPPALPVEAPRGRVAYSDIATPEIMLRRNDVFARLLTFPNVVVTGHQAFFTEDAMSAIAECTIANLDTFEAEGCALHVVSVEHLA